MLKLPVKLTNLARVFTLKLRKSCYSCVCVCVRARVSVLNYESESWVTRIQLRHLSGRPQEVLLFLLADTGDQETIIYYAVHK